ncbi:MAG: hypothetical protein GYB68_04405 [Chloroflexi bacterium]|nr:hypothetical protein [Chloroflexota bacterium]
MLDSFDRLAEAVASVDHNVIVIADVRSTDKLPANLLGKATMYAQHDFWTLPNLWLHAAISDRRSHHRMSEIITSVFPAFATLKVFDDLEEARIYIEETLGVSTAA